MGDSSKIVETSTYQYEANTIIAEGIIEGDINKTSLEEIGKHENIDGCPGNTHEESRGGCVSKYTYRE